MIKKILITIMMTLTLLMSANAITLQLDQDNNLLDFRTLETGNKVISTHANSVDTVLSVDNAQQNYTYDYKLEIVEATEDFYLVLDNTFVNSTYNILYRGDLNIDPTLYTQEVTLNEQGQYFFKFSPTRTEQPIVVYIDMEIVQGQGGAFTVAYIEEKPKGFNDLIGGFIGAFEEVFDINVKLWYLLYYIIIIVLVLAFIGILFGLGGYIIKLKEDQKNGAGFFDFSKEDKKNKKEDID